MIIDKTDYNIVKSIVNYNKKINNNTWDKNNLNATCKLLFNHYTTQVFILNKCSMKLLIFLGNPWPQYELTKHNIWFLIGDHIAYRWDCEEWSTHNAGKSLMTSTIQEGEKVILIKPQTYMNLSGQSAAYWCWFYKILPKDIIVIHDDIDLPAGTIRYKFWGNSWGQNGIKDIIQKLWTDQFSRVKIGIWRPDHPWYSVADYVLSKLPTTELDMLGDYTTQVLQKISHHFLDKKLQEEKKSV